MSIKWYGWAIITIAILAIGWIAIYIDRGFDPLFHIGIIIFGALDIWINIWWKRDYLE